VFSAFSAPSLTDRLRALCLVPLAAFLLAEGYFSAIPWLPAVPRWLFEAVRLLLLAGALGGLLGGGALAWRRRAEVGWAAAAWLGLVAVLALLCGWLLAGMSVPLLLQLPL